ncbi:MAG: protein-L-isoaspartate(D-aspartate) O-methyltransferase [Myxococcales bacterium]|jgi:protein-L-isoaspartate(D-aspartate) O-methyltransferase|nr:protein-L-isoaspartate(D-aspartate) O-methyltransferase [Myxococcales bacterium]
MVKTQLIDRGIEDARVLSAFAEVPRHEFVPPEQILDAYADWPLPVGLGQTISQPYVVALTIEALHLRGPERVLEIGTGSGYAAAILSHLCQAVYTIERLEPLARAARERLSRLGFKNVAVYHGDGSLGWPDAAPFAAILVSAAGPQVPRALLDQLAPGGRLIMPVGAEYGAQELVCVSKDRDGTLRREPLGGVRFVPLLGAQGFPTGRSGED